MQERPLADSPERLALLSQQLKTSPEALSRRLGTVPEARIPESQNIDEIDPLQQPSGRQPPLPVPLSVGGDRPDTYPAPVFSQMEHLQRAYADMNPQQQQILGSHANSLRQQEAFQLALMAMVQQHQMTMAALQAMLDSAKQIRG
jgi:hypothetical protein